MPQKPDTKDEPVNKATPKPDARATHDKLPKGGGESEASRQADKEAPPPPQPPAVGDSTPPVPGTALTAGGVEHGEDLPAPPNAPVATEVPPAEAPPPPKPPAVGDDRPDQTPEEISEEARTPPDSSEEPGDLEAQQNRGAPAPYWPEQAGSIDRELDEYIAKNREKLLNELALEKLRGGLPQGLPTTGLPTAALLGSPVLPGQTERTTQGQPEYPLVFFRADGAEDLNQVLDDGSTVSFKGSIFSTTDPATVDLLRKRIDKGRALFYEDDPEVKFNCPYCKFSSMKKATTNSHIRTRHAGKDELE